MCAEMLLARRKGRSIRQLKRTIELVPGHCGKYFINVVHL